MDERKFLVFISSTYDDMHSERQAAIEAVLSAGHIPIGMEFFGAENRGQLDVIKKCVDKSDIFVLILGGRYGTIAEQHKSYIQIEYEYAKKTKRPSYSIIIDTAALAKKINELGPNVMESANLSSYALFKKEIERNVCCYYRDMNELKLHIVNSINKCGGDEEILGWVPGSFVKKYSELAIENGRLKLQVEEARKNHGHDLANYNLVNEFQNAYDSLIHEIDANIIWARDIYTTLIYLRDEAWIRYKNNGYIKFFTYDMGNMMSEVYGKMYAVNQVVNIIKEGKKISADKLVLYGKLLNEFIVMAAGFKRSLIENREKCKQTVLLEI